MDKFGDQLCERLIAQALESTGFSAISKIAHQKLHRIPTLKIRALGNQLSMCMNARHGENIVVDDVVKVLMDKNENIPQLVRFLQSYRRIKSKPHPAYPIKKFSLNPLKIPEKDSYELSTQPKFVDDHLPLMREALEYKSNSRRLQTDGSTPGSKHQLDQKAFGDQHTNGEHVSSGPNAKPAYPLEAGRSRYKLRACVMDEEGRVFSQGSGNRRQPDCAPPSATFINPIDAAVTQVPGSEMLVAPYKKVTGHRTHSKNGVISTRSAERRGDPFMTNSFTTLAGCGDSREHNGAYSPPRDDLPEVEDDEDVHPGRAWPPKEEPVGPKSFTDLSKERESAGRAPNVPLEWPPSSKPAPALLSGPVPTPPSSLALSGPLPSSARSSKMRKSDRSASSCLSSKHESPASTKKPSLSKSGSRSSLLSSSKSKPKSKSKSKVKGSVSKHLSSKSSSHLKKSVHNGQATTFVPTDLAPVREPPRDRKRTYEEANSSSGTPTELASPTVPSRRDLGIPYEAPLALSIRPSSHKAASKDGSRASSPVPKFKRRRLDGGASDVSSRAKSLSPPRSPVLPASPIISLTSGHRERPARSERSRGNTPKRRPHVFSSSEDEGFELSKVLQKGSSSGRSSPAPKHREWEDVPLSKRVPSITKRDTSRSRERRETTPVSEEPKDNDESLVKLGMGLTMKFNLTKIKKLCNYTADSGTASPASGATAPAAAADSKPGSPSCPKVEEEYEWVREAACARRRRSGSLSDGGDDYAVMRFQGPPGPSPPPLADTEISFEQPAPDLEEERRGSLDSLPPPSLMPTVPLPKMKIKKIKGTTSSFVTAPADSEAESSRSTKTAPVGKEESAPRLPSLKPKKRQHSSRSPSPPTLAPALTPPPPPCAAPTDEQAPTLTLSSTPAPALANVVDDVVLDASDDEMNSNSLVHIPNVVKPTKKSGGSASKKTKRSSSSAKSRARPRPRPSPIRSATPPTPPAVIEAGADDLGGFISNAVLSSEPSPPEPTPEPEVRPSSRSAASKKSSQSHASGHSSSRKSAGVSEVNLSGIDGSNNNTTTTTTKKAANSSKSKSAAKAAGANAAAAKMTSAPPPADASSSSMGIDLVSHGSSYYFDSNGLQIWICPTCHMEDNGTLMIGCDACDDWYHGHCLRIYEAPTEQNWYCPRCIQTNKPLSQKPTKKRKSMKSGRRR